MAEPTVKFVSPKKQRIPPRAEAVIRFVNDTVLHNLRLGKDSTQLILPSLVERAYNIVYETSTIEYRKYPSGITTRKKQ